MAAFASTGERERRQGRLLTWLSPSHDGMAFPGHCLSFFGCLAAIKRPASPLWRCPDRASPDARPQPPNNLSTCQALINRLLVPIAGLQAPHVHCSAAPNLGRPSDQLPRLSAAVEMTGANGHAAEPANAENGHVTVTLEGQLPKETSQLTAQLQAMADQFKQSSSTYAA